MIKELITYMKFFHGVFNTLVVILFMYQGMIGLRIRKSPNSPAHIRSRHRKIGPVAVMMGLVGFLAGMSITYLDHGRILKYPIHFLNGLIVVCLLITTYLISKKIKGPELTWRNRHFAIGIFIIIFYMIQLILGLGLIF